MGIVRYNVEVTRVDEYEIAIDDSVWTEEKIQEWSSHFYKAKGKKDFIGHLAKSISHEDNTGEGMEGFGYVKQRHSISEEGDLINQYTEKRVKVTEEDYTEGLSVIIINHKEDYETEIMKLRTK